MSQSPVFYTVSATDARALANAFARVKGDPAFILFSARPAFLGLLKAMQAGRRVIIEGAPAPLPQGLEEQP